jgi:hypothetical protein
MSSPPRKLACILIPLLTAACQPPGGVAVAVGPGGGTIDGPRGASITVPPGALDGEVTIGLAPGDAGAPALPAGLTPAGETFELTPHGQRFAVPVTLTLPLDAGRLPPGRRVVLWKTENGAQGPWARVPGAHRMGDALSAELTGFSYVVPTSEPDEGDGPPSRASCARPPTIGTIRLRVGANEPPRDPLSGMYLVPYATAFVAEPVGFEAGGDAIQYQFDAFWQGPMLPPSFPNERGQAEVSGARIDYASTLSPTLYGIFVRATSCGGSADSNIVYAVEGGPRKPQALYRTSGGDVQTFRLDTSGLSLVDTDAATPHGGSGSVAVAWNGDNHVVRSSAGDVQSFTLFPMTSVKGTDGGTPSPTGVGLAAQGLLVVRASDVGLETFRLMNEVPLLLTPKPVAGTASGTGVALALSRRFAVRAHAGGIDVFDLIDPAAPRLAGSAASQGRQISSVGVGVCLAGSGTLAVRSGPVGIDVFALAPDGTPTLAGAFTSGTPSLALNTAVAVDRTGLHAVRAHASGIEVYDLTRPDAPQRLGARSGAASTTGVGVFVLGDRAVRATNAELELYDLTDPSNLPAPSSLAATPSFVGVGLTGRYGASIPQSMGWSVP